MNTKFFRFIQLGSTRFVTIVCIVILCISPVCINATNYYVHPNIGDDKNAGTNVLQPFKSLNIISSLQLVPGDKVLLAAGHTFTEMLKLEQVRGGSGNPIQVGSYQWENTYESPKAIIDASFSPHGIHLIDCSHIDISDIIIVASDADGSSTQKMRCGILVETKAPGLYRNISLSNLVVRDMFIESKAMDRGDNEVRTANGAQRYGWGIRFISKGSDAELKDLSVRNCIVKNIAHTGIKFTSNGKRIYNVSVKNNRVVETGGPGIQMSGVKFGLFANNYVSDSGSDNDNRKWGRGSGLWTWGSSDIIIEKNYFLNANGPGDSAGCHIDFNCNDIVVQYNFSANNAGGFCEILGNNYNCAYRYNISVNDGYRVKGEDNAFQEGKIFWLSGYTGKKKPRSGPFNSYFYNNTMYVNQDIVAKMAVSKVAEGALIANNIFYIIGESKAVSGDQYVPEQSGDTKVKNIHFKNNVYLSAKNWPEDIWIQDERRIIGDPEFRQAGGMNLEDYIPTNAGLISNKGIDIHRITEDSIGLKIGLRPSFDILGNPIIGAPDIGAIEILE